MKRRKTVFKCYYFGLRQFASLSVVGCWLLVVDCWLLVRASPDLWAWDFSMSSNKD